MILCKLPNFYLKNLKLNTIDKSKASKLKNLVKKFCKNNNIILNRNEIFLLNK